MIESSSEVLKNYSDKYFLILDENKQTLRCERREKFNLFSKWMIKLGLHSASLKKVAGFINQRFDDLKKSLGHQPGNYWNLLDDNFNPFGYELINAYSNYFSFHSNSREVRKLARNFMIHCVDPNIKGEKRERIVQAHRNITKLFKSLVFSNSLIYADTKGDLHRVNRWNLFGRIKVAYKQIHTQKVIEQTFNQMTGFLQKVNSSLQYLEHPLVGRYDSIRLTNRFPMPNAVPIRLTESDKRSRWRYSAFHDFLPAYLRKLGLDPMHATYQACQEIIRASQKIEDELWEKHRDEQIFYAALNPSQRYRIF